MIDTTLRLPQGLSRRQALRLPRISRICRDLASGEVSVRTTLPELTVRYGPDAWPDYKQALRDYAYDHGCLVLVDDQNDGRFVAMMEHFGRDIAPEEASAYFRAPLAEYRKRLQAAEAEALPDNVIPLQRKPSCYSVYRLPLGDYSGDTQPFFDERGEFIWETFA